MAPRVPRKKLIVRKSPKDQEILHALFENNHIPSWEDYEKLKAFLSIRGRIVGRAQTRLSAKQQRQLSEAIKRARHLGLLPFVIGA